MSLERQLARRLAKGDGEALAGLYDLYAERVYHYALALVRSAHDAEDVVQEVFVRLARGRSKFGAVRDVTGYVFAMARNEVMRLLRRRKRHERRVAKAAPLLFADPEARSDSHVRAEAAECALFALPVQDMEVIVLRIFEELTFEEVGRALRISAATAWRRYARAMEKLRARLEVPQGPGSGG